jgi:hypothetical protein
MKADLIKRCVRALAEAGGGCRILDRVNPENLE